MIGVFWFKASFSPVLGFIPLHTRKPKSFSDTSKFENIRFITS